MNKAVDLNVLGMTCQGCVRNVTGVLRALPGVIDADVSLEKAQARVVFDAERIDETALRNAIEGAGFDLKA